MPDAFLMRSSGQTPTKAKPKAEAQDPRAFYTCRRGVAPLVPVGGGPGLMARATALCVVEYETHFRYFKFKFKVAKFCEQNS